MTTSKTLTIESVRREAGPNPDGWYVVASMRRDYRRSIPAPDIQTLTYYVPLTEPTPIPGSEVDVSLEILS